MVRRENNTIYTIYTFGVVVFLAPLLAAANRPIHPETVLRFHIPSMMRFRSSSRSTTPGHRYHHNNSSLSWQLYLDPLADNPREPRFQDGWQLTHEVCLIRLGNPLTIVYLLTRC